MPVTDERTMAAWLSAPTEARAEVRRDNDEPVIVDRCEVEEHVTDPETGTTKRCDATLWSGNDAVFNAELKRPEVAVVDDYFLKKDAHTKANARGLRYYATVNFQEAALWRTEDGPGASRALVRRPIAEGLDNSPEAHRYRDELRAGWKRFLDEVEDHVRSDREQREQRRSVLPPQVQALSETIRAAGEEGAERVAAAIAADRDFAARVREQFDDQFGVDVALDPEGGDAVRFERECEQVATISAFVVVTRLLLYVALRRSGQDLDPLSIDPQSTDPGRVAAHLQGLYDHARYETDDFDLQLQATEVDDIIFTRGGNRGNVGQIWSRIADVVEGASWDRPAEYVPGLYESLLTDEHRHAMGVHYTPDPVAELLVGYAIEDAADTVLDPASGAGTFAVTAYHRKRQLGSMHEQTMEEVYANELARFAAGLTMLNLSLAEGTAEAAYPRVVHKDFFTLRPGGDTGIEMPARNGPLQVQLPGSFDAVVGNPPYVRFEQRTDYENDLVERALAWDSAHRRLNFPDFTGKADLYSYFIAHAASFLEPGGRLAFIVSWSLLSTVYGDRVLEFLGRYFHIEALIDSKVERFFAAETNTVMIFARRVPGQPGDENQATFIPIHEEHEATRLVRLKRPLDELWNPDAAAGKRCEDLVHEILNLEEGTDDYRWDVRVVSQQALVEAAP